ncbi:MAG TPA: hypothetical protein VFV23_12830 [Verrucomicrobiae bacterium]|nr:hypothetical protein [Verrucomicrobiae bacterium]
MTMFNSGPARLTTKMPEWRRQCIFFAQYKSPFKLEGITSDDSSFIQQLCDVFCYHCETASERCALFTPFQ